MNEVAGGLACPQCNRLNVSTASFCSGCGAALGHALETAPDAAPTARMPYAQPPMQPSMLGQPQAPGMPIPYDQPYPPGVPISYTQPMPVAGSPGQPYLQGPPRYPLPASYTQPYPTLAYGQPPPAAPMPGQPYYGYGAPITPINVNVSPIINVAMPAMQAPAPAPPVVVVNNMNMAPPVVVRALWFVFCGLWLGLIATVVGWALCIGVVTLPLGLLILNRLPALMTLRPASRTTQVLYANGVTVINTNVAAKQHPLALRALYFLFVGSWFTALWLVLAWCLVAITPVTLGASLALAFMMFDRVPQVLTLRVN